MGDLVSRPSRLGLALAATVAVSSLTFGGGIASAAPEPGSDECKTLVEADKRVTDAPEAEKLAAIRTVTDELCTGPEAATGGGNAENNTGTGGGNAENNTGGTGGTGGGNAENNTGGTGGGAAVGSGYTGVTQGVMGKNPRNVNCRDFKTQPAAQAYYDAYPGDPARLDRDKDGKACESLADLRGAKIAQVSDKDLDKTADDESEVEGDQVSEVPEGSVDTGGYDR